MRINFFTHILAPAVMLAAAATSIPAMAEATTVKVPFSFQAAGKAFPAGTYSVQRDIPGDFLRFQAKGSAQVYTWVAGPSNQSGEHVSLKFDEVGQTHVLQSIQYGGLITAKLDGKKNSKHTTVSAETGQ